MKTNNGSQFGKIQAWMNFYTKIILYAQHSFSVKIVTVISCIKRSTGVCGSHDL